MAINFFPLFSVAKRNHKGSHTRSLPAPLASLGTVAAEGRLALLARSLAILAAGLWDDLGSGLGLSLDLLGGRKRAQQESNNINIETTTTSMTIKITITTAARAEPHKLGQQ